MVSVWFWKFRFNNISYTTGKFLFVALTFCLCVSFFLCISLSCWIKLNLLNEEQKRELSRVTQCFQGKLCIPILLNSTWIQIGKIQKQQQRNTFPLVLLSFLQEKEVTTEKLPRAARPDSVLLKLPHLKRRTCFALCTGFPRIPLCVHPFQAVLCASCDY